VPAPDGPSRHYIHNVQQTRLDEPAEYAAQGGLDH
jgi:hypothetical protein